MKKVLIVEDSAIVMKVLLHIAQQELAFELLPVASFAEARECCEQYGDDIFAALVDLNLPDAPSGEVVDFTLEKHIPTIVLTGSFDDDLREKLLSKGVVDYVNKEGRYSYRYAVNAINRLWRNQSVKVLVVEDSNMVRKQIVSLLKRHQFTIFEATDGIEAIKVILDHPDIQLLITDYNMPNMDGFELVKNLRCQYEKFDLIIIGLSGEGKTNLSARFIKTGANDFLIKPFNPEEFYCRINHNIDSLDLIEKIRDSANRDHLSGLYSRNYFFEKGIELYQQAVEKQSPLAFVVIHLDDFKQVNDTYGPEITDCALHHFAQLLEEYLSRFLVARSVGAEFYVLMPGLLNEKAVTLLSRVSAMLNQSPYRHKSENGEEYQVPVTFSAGVSNRLATRLSEQLIFAEQCLARAEEAGKDIVFGDDEDAAIEIPVPVLESGSSRPPNPDVIR